ncbi:hypothetical protein [Geopseudomonas aromaticivorans]
MFKNTKAFAKKLLPIAALVIGANALVGCSKKEEALESYYDADFTREMNEAGRKPLNWKGEAPIFVAVEGASASCYITAGVGGTEEWERRWMGFGDGAAVTLFDTGSTRACLSGGGYSVVAFWDPKDQKFTAYTWGANHRISKYHREPLNNGYRKYDRVATIEKISIYMENLMATKPFEMKGFDDYNQRAGKAFMHEVSERLNDDQIGEAIRGQIAEVNARYR